MAAASAFPPGARCVYVDSNIWIALLTAEASLPAVRQWLADEPGLLVTAEWTRAEIASALAIKCRRGEFGQPLLTRMLRVWGQLENRLVRMLPAQSADFAQAAQWCATASHALRSGNALHLAVAARHQASHLATHDQRMLEFAPRLGLEPLVFR